jgi:murein DD-endopeptidase MepM/ murein hydrolase activator NlpD
MKKESNYYTLMFIPANNGKTFTLSIHKYILRSLLIFIVIFTTGLLLLLFKSGEIAAKLQLLYVIKLENEKLSTENKQLRSISKEFSKIESLSKYLERLASVSAASKYENKPVLQKSLSENDQVIPQVNQQIQTVTPNAIGIQENGSLFNSIPNISPVEGWITRPFLNDSIESNKGHRGIDIAAASGTPIRATASGIVSDIQNDKDFGLVITIQHDRGYITKYNHCLQILVSLNTIVKKGQTIALVGNTGRSSAPHLHYEILKDGKYINPSTLMSHNE